jgi:hypothetical protein
LLARRFAQANADKWFIFSAKHGLLDPGAIIAPYDLRISALSDAEQSNLVSRLRKQVAALKLRSGTKIVSLCDEQYNGALISAGLKLAHAPVATMTKVEKRFWLRQQTDPQSIETDLNSMYATIGRLHKSMPPKPFKQFIQDEMPKSGVYLFFDKSETRLASGGLRIVRIGTHGVAAGSKASLRDRMRTHFGSGTGGGNHRSSIFRLHVGRSLINRGDVPSAPSWGTPEFPSSLRDRKQEEAVEAAVSEYIGDLSVSVLNIPGDSSKHNDRAYVEQNLIALVSNVFRPLDPPSHSWLGNHSDKLEIRKSGIWNVNHTAQTYERAFMPMLDYYVAHTLGTNIPSTKPVAPSDWAANVRRDTRQLSFF